MFNFLRKIGKSNKLDNFQEVHSGDDFKILKANKKVSLDTLKNEVSDLSTEKVTKIIKENKSILRKHTTYYKSGSFIITLIPTGEELKMELFEPPKGLFGKGVNFLTN